VFRPECLFYEVDVDVVAAVVVVEEKHACVARAGGLDESAGRAGDGLVAGAELVGAQGCWLGWW
jgi:hypothetical protein